MLDLQPESDEKEPEEVTDELPEAPIFDDSRTTNNLSRGVSEHLSSERAQRAAAAQPKEEFRNNKANRIMDWWVQFDGRLFSTKMTAKTFSELQNPDKLILAVALIRTTKFASIFDTEQKIRNYLLTTINKGRDENSEDYIDDKSLDRLIDETVKSGQLATNEIGPILTSSGMSYLIDTFKSKGW